MFFELIRRNSRRNRKENGLFFSSLVISVIAFYIILSLENQDVIKFLKTMESDAVNKLLSLIPILYGISLFLLFFLVYFANKYQLERRNHEFGIYLMMGMRRPRLFAILVAEDIMGSLMALLVGIPAAMLLSEVVSLVISRLAGLGIIGHQVTFSLKASALTTFGFFAIKFMALIILSFKITRKDIQDLLKESREEKAEMPSKKTCAWKLFLSVVILTAAYILGITGQAWKHITYFGLTMVLGIGGTFLFFQGFSACLELVIRSGKRKKDLDVFTFRQFQENVVHCWTSLAVSSLLALLALCCFGFGIAMGVARSHTEHILDYTISEDMNRETSSGTGGEDTAGMIQKSLDRPELKEKTDVLFEVKTGIFLSRDDLPEDLKDRVTHELDISPLLDAVKRTRDTEEKKILLDNLRQLGSPYLISLSGYNRILQLKGETPLKLTGNEIALYNDPDYTNERLEAILSEVLEDSIEISIDKKPYTLANKLYHDNIVVDQAINIAYGFIVSDNVFENLAYDASKSSYWNITLKKNFVEKEGLMQAISQVNEVMDETGLVYESYLQNMGRQMFYLVGAGYMTVYLAIIFLIIANTVIGVQFLMQQRKAGRRYRTLIFLGCGYAALCGSARSQIRWYFGLPVTVAAVSGIFGVKSMFSGLLPVSVRNQVLLLMIIAAVVMAVLCVIEYSYIRAVMKLSDRYIRTLMQKENDR